MPLTMSEDDGTRGLSAPAPRRPQTDDPCRAAPSGFDGPFQ